MVAVVCALRAPAPGGVGRAATFSPGRSLAGRGTARQRPLPAPLVWKEAQDGDTGDTYYWNSKTKEVAWELPAGAELERPAAAAARAAAAEEKEERAAAAASETGAPSYGEILEALADAAENDPNAFGTVANAFRPHGVFSVDFMVHLEGELKAAARGDFARAEVLQKVQARIANPLLKQGEFY